MRFRFTIRDFFWACLCCSICLAWYVDAVDGPPPAVIPQSWRPLFQKMHDGLPIEDPKPDR